MKNGSTLFLKIVILFIAILVLFGMIRFPQTEGRAANLDLISIYADPIIIYAYIASIPFFVGMYQGFKLLGLIEKNKAFSQASVKALRSIKYCAIATICFILLAQAFLVFGVQGEDKAGPIALGLYMIVASTVVATTAGLFERLISHKQ